MPKQATGTGTIRRAIDSLSAAELHRSSGVKWRLFGEDVLPAWVADMDFPVAPPVHRAIRDLVGRCHRVCVTLWFRAWPSGSPGRSSHLESFPW